MSELVDLGAAATDMKRVLAGLGPDVAQRPTPCAEFNVSDLLDHCHDATKTLTAAALGGPDPAAESSGACRHDENVAVTLAIDLDRLADAWRDPDLPGRETTTAGGVTMPVSFHNMIAVQEMVLHAWDLAAATDQEFHPDPSTLGKLHAFLAEHAADAPHDGSGPFGPAVSVTDDASLLDRVLGLSGRDPGCRPTD